MEKLFSPKQEAKFRELYPILPMADLLKRFPFTKAQLRCAASRMRLNKSGKLFSWRYSEELKLIELYPDHRNADIAKLLSKTDGSIISAGFKLKLRKDPAKHAEWSAKGYFQKGQAPPNKGKKMPKAIYKKCKATMFKKGTVPPNHQPVGYERITVDGYTEIKTGEGLRMFKLKHRVEWEKVNGKLPKGMILVCKSDNKQDCSPANWEPITRAENMSRNTCHNYPKEIASLIQLRGALNRQINKKAKQLQNEK